MNVKAGNSFNYKVQKIKFKCGRNFVEIRLMQPKPGKIWKLNSKIIDNKYKSNYKV